jgi:hypothetical protein
MRDTLFISHATPEDNEFAIWLASRLEMFGYKTWIDKEGLLGGEKFWETIQNEIRDRAIKVLFVYSNNICDKDGNLKNGIYKEWSYAESIAAQYSLSDFIIPLHLEATAPYNVFIGANMINHIPFESNWADGFRQLLKKLEKDDIPKKKQVTESSFSEWYENEYISNYSIVSKTELYYTSWWQIDKLPPVFYMYQFHNEKQAIEIQKLNDKIPISRQSNIISSFDEYLNYTVTRDDDVFDVEPESVFKFSLSQIIEGFDSDIFPQHKDVENFFKRLLTNIIVQLFKRKGLWKTELSNKKYAFYLPLYKDLKPIKFHYAYSDLKKAPKRKTIAGKFEKIGHWHYALSTQTILFPIVGFSLKSHLIFTTDGFKIIDDSKKAHSYRRKKGKRFFNEEWRDMMLAFLQYLKDEDNEIKIIVSKNGDALHMKEYPEKFWSEVGYHDPKTFMSLEKIENYVEQVEEDML